jgi:trigger factor
MNVTIEHLSPVKKKIKFDIPAEHVTSEIDKSLAMIQKKANIKGFRKGKAPRSQVEKVYGAQMQEEVMRNLFQQTYYQALTEHKIMPVAHPEVEFDTAVAKDTSFAYSATVEVFPEVTVKEYAGLEVNKEAYVFTPEVIDQRITEMRESMAELKPVEDVRPVAAGDFVTLDFDGSIDGVAIPGGSANDFQLEIGSGRFIPGFEDQLIGLPVGEERQITVTFPSDYQATELAGKEAHFAITIKEIKVKELPELTDEFAQQFGEYETLAALRTALEEMYAKQQQERIESDLRDRLIEALIARNEFEVPSTMVDQQVAQMLENAKRRLASQRMTLEMMGMDEQQYKLQFRGVAESQVKGGLLLDSLATIEGIEVSDDEIETKVNEIAGEDEQNRERIKTYYAQNKEARDNLRAHLREEKALALLLDKAVITEVPAEQLKK